MHAAFIAPGSTASTIHPSLNESLSPTVLPWHREMYSHKGLLRTTWRRLEQLGEGETFVKGVGAGQDPEAEWEACMRKLLNRGTTERDRG